MTYQIPIRPPEPLYIYRGMSMYKHEDGPIKLFNYKIRLQKYSDGRFKEIDLQLQTEASEEEIKYFAERYK